MFEFVVSKKGLKESEARYLQIFKAMVTDQAANKVDIG